MEHAEKCTFTNTNSLSPKNASIATTEPAGFKSATYLVRANNGKNVTTETERFHSKTWKNCNDNFLINQAK